MKYKTILIIFCLVIFSLFFLYFPKSHLKLKGEDTPEVQNLQKLADQGDVQALLELAKRYKDSLEYAFGLFSYDTDPYYEKILELYERAARQGNAEAQHEVAMIYYNGLGVERDYRKGIEWDEKAAKQNYLIAKLVLASVYSENNAGPDNPITDPQKALYWYQQASLQGSSSADFSVGMSYYYGNGTTVDYQKALVYLNKSADAGNIQALTALGNFYENCNTGFCDNNKAKYFYEKAANNEESIAQYNLGRFYEHGLTGEQNYTKAMYWYQKAEERGNGLGALAVAQLYQEGKGIPQDYLEAKKHYEIATIYGEPNGYYQIGLLYKNGLGVGKDIVKANHNFQKALEYYEAFSKYKDDTDAQYMLGILYMNGDGVEKNMVTAKKWFKKAANNGHIQAKNILFSLS